MSTDSGRPPFFEKPVAWLLGRQLIGALKGGLLYAAYGKKIDPRDWMTAKPVHWDQQPQSEFWFDYISDVGDGTRAMYSTAYLAMCRSLGTKLTPAATDLPADPDDCEVTTSPYATDTTYQLPRGEFLFVGGDTAYHTAAYMTLVNRIQHPFKYAFLDLVEHGLIAEDEPRRPIYGIPGNHDYYDQLDGFRRQFRTPTRPEGPLPPQRSSPEYAQLTIAGFRRDQEASYVALRLPFGWWFWGLDTEPGLIDRRQANFFEKLGEAEGGFPPDRLILATCSPSTVCGHLAPPDDYKVAASITHLGVGTPFLPGTDASGKPDLAQSGDAKLQSGQCRLDLSGDVHHYARYWGPKPANVDAPREHRQAPAPAADSYASVVSGAGAAFHHPTTTYDDEICEQALYPSEPVSREAIGNRIAAFWNVITGGYIWLVGGIIAFLIFFGATVPQSSRQFLGNIGLLRSLNSKNVQVVSPEAIEPTIIDFKACDPIEPFALWSMLGISPATRQAPGACSPANPSYYFGSSVSWPADLVIGQVLLSLALIGIVVTLIISAFTKKIFTDKNPYEEPPDPDKKLWWIIIVTTIVIFLGFLSIKPYRYHISPFGSSVVVLFSFFTAVVAIILAIRYNGYLTQKSFYLPSLWGSDWILPFVLWFLAILIAASGLWFFGRNNQPAFLVADLLFFGAILTLAFCVMVLPFKVGGDLLYTQSKGVRIAGKTLIAVWHLILQLFVPYLLIKTGNGLTWVLAAILLFVPIPLTKSLIKKNSGLGVSVLWVVYGLVMLTLPWITMLVYRLVDWEYSPVFLHTAGWPGLVPSVLAGAVGAVICCLWTGWYFVVCFVFNGHNNEVGGAARVEGFKQFIRFRLTAESLTGYVIAVDDVSIINRPDASGGKMNGKDLKPRLVDVFQLKPKP